MTDHEWAKIFDIIKKTQMETVNVYIYRSRDLIYYEQLAGIHDAKNKSEQEEGEFIADYKIGFVYNMAEWKLSINNNRISSASSSDDEEFPAPPSEPIIITSKSRTSISEVSLFFC